MRNLLGMRGPRLPELVLSAEERTKLEMLVRRPKTAQRMALRARIVLMAADGAANKRLAAELRISRATVIKWRERFRVHRLEGLLDEPRVQAARVATDEVVEQVVTQTLESTPVGKTHWSQRDMARHAGLSRATVARIWKAFALQPHRSETFKLSPDPQFIEKVRDVVGLYMNPPENAVVLCVDEKSQIQALERTQPILPLRPGVPERQTHDYARNGTTTLFAALNAHTGEVVRKCYRRHRAKEYLSFLRLLDAALPETDSIHLVVDNYATHKTPAVQRWFARHPRFHVHFTPTYASWLNLVERLFAEVTDKAIRRGSFPSVLSLERAIEQYLAAREDKPYVWTASADTILRRVAKNCL
jgi:transcriptional regulator with XRE-family HTH domain